MADIDTTEIGIAAAELMEKLGNDYPDGSIVREVICIVEVEVPEDDDPEESHTEMDWWCSSERRVVQVGLIRLAEKLFAEEWLIGTDEDDDEPEV